MTSININQPEFHSVETLTQNPTTATRVMIVAPTSQEAFFYVVPPGVPMEAAVPSMEYDPDMTRPRHPRFARDRLFWKSLADSPA